MLVDDTHLLLLQKNVNTQAFIKILNKFFKKDHLPGNKILSVSPKWKDYEF